MPLLEQTGAGRANGADGFRVELAAERRRRERDEFLGVVHNMPDARSVSINPTSDSTSLASSCSGPRAPFAGSVFNAPALGDQAEEAAAPSTVSTA